MKSKHTKGEIIVWKDLTRISTTGNGNLLRVIASVNRNKYIEREEASANAQLIADAFNVTNETGMTPRELQARHVQLLEALAEISLGQGAYDTDILRHANNTIEIMKSIVEQAINNANK